MQSLRRQTWQDAATHCQHMGAYLTSIDSAHEMQLLQSETESFSPFISLFGEVIHLGMYKEVRKADGI